MANKKRRCTYCKKYKEADKGIVAPIGFFCDKNCRYDYATKSTKALISKSNKIETKRNNAELKKRKEAIKPKAKWLSELQAVFNKYVRLRDINDGCISCDKTKDWLGQWHASHYFSRGHSSALRFNLHNVHKSCSVCNSHLSGNIGQYTPRIIEKIGQERFDLLVTHKSDIAIYDIAWIKRAIKITKKAIKRLESYQKYSHC